MPNPKSAQREISTNKSAREDMEKLHRHQAAGRFDQAFALLDDLEKIHGDTARLQHYRGVTHAMAGDPDAGEALMRAALERAPRDPVQMLDLGVHLAQSGRIDEALTHFERAVELAPNYENARANLGAAYLAQKDHRRAIPHLQAAASLDPSLLDVHLNLGIAFQDIGQHGKAVDTFFRALALDPNSGPVHAQLANALYSHERHDSAEYHARRAIELQPDAVQPYLTLANVQAARGDADAAEATLLTLAAMPGRGMAALGRLIQLRKVTADSAAMQGLSEALQSLDSFPDQPKTSVLFAAAKAYDDLGDPDTAFGYLRQANDLTAALHPFDAAAFHARVDRLAALADPEELSNWASDALHHIAPVFVTGMPRSGTTLTEQMFSRHSAVTAGGEMSAMPDAMWSVDAMRLVLQGKAPADILTPEDAADIGAAYMDHVQTHGIRSTYLTDKMPANYQNAAAILAALPRAKIIIMRRHPLACLLSNYFQNFGASQTFSARFDQLADVYRTFDKVAQHLVATFPDQVREQSYEALTHDAEAEMRSLLEWVGLDWEPEVLEFAASSRPVNTASVAQVRQPLYSGSVARWHAYAPMLTDLARDLAPYLSAEDLARCGVE